MKTVLDITPQHFKNSFEMDVASGVEHAPRHPRPAAVPLALGNNKDELKRALAQRRRERQSLEDDMAIDEILIRELTEKKKRRLARVQELRHDVATLSSALAASKHPNGLAPPKAEISHRMQLPEQTPARDEKALEPILAEECTKPMQLPRRAEQSGQTPCTFFWPDLETFGLSSGPLPDVPMPPDNFNS